MQGTKNCIDIRQIVGFTWMGRSEMWVGDIKSKLNINNKLYIIYEEKKH